MNAKQKAIQAKSKELLTSIISRANAAMTALEKCPDEYLEGDLVLDLQDIDEKVDSTASFLEDEFK